jgi:tungstate transport system substrate-binding protein
MQSLSSIGRGLVLVAVVILFSIHPCWSSGQKVLMMATTTSTDNTGLLDYLAPHFTRDTGIELRWTSTGTGKALALGQHCDVDVLLVHAPDAEIAFVKAGHGVNRLPVMYNDFVIIGPATDPAGVKGHDVPAALAAIASHKAVFVSRGDDSGTHQKELALWPITGSAIPEREAWYIQAGQGMLATINMAAERQGYTMTDRGTFIKYAHDHSGDPPLVILVEGDASLQNPYAVITVNPQRCPTAKAQLADRFGQWLVGPRGQQLIADFKLMGQAMFFPGAR